MLIVIPSKGRHGKKLVTWNSIKEAELEDRTVIVVPHNEVDWYESSLLNAEVVGTPPEIKGISATRKWILLDFAKSRKLQHVLMLDDDMDFCKRTDVKKSAKLVMLHDKAGLRKMFDTLEGWLTPHGDFVHVGLSARQGNHGKNVPWYDGTRMMNAYAYDCSTIRHLVEQDQIELGRLPVMEDFDLTLQLLRLGYANRVSYEYCWNQRGTNQSGGCANYRTVKIQEEAAHKLKKFHPDFVKVVKKTNKDTSPAWAGMKERTDVTVDWQGALKEGLEL
jgi:hypothetical protein